MMSLRRWCLCLCSQKQRVYLLQKIQNAEPLTLFFLMQLPSLVYTSRINPSIFFTLTSVYHFITFCIWYSHVHYSTILVTFFYLEKSFRLTFGTYITTLVLETYMLHNNSTLTLFSFFNDYNFYFCSIMLPAKTFWSSIFFIFVFLSNINCLRGSSHRIFLSRYSFDDTAKQNLCLAKSQ